MVDIKNLSKIKRVHRISVRFQFPGKGKHYLYKDGIHHIFMERKPVAYINKNYLYYANNDSQMLGMVMLSDVCDYENVINRIEELCGFGWGNRELYVVCSDEEADDLLKDIKTIIHNAYDNASKIDQKKKELEEFIRCKLYVAAYKEKYGDEVDGV